MMQKNVWAVICGSIRDELDFKLTLTRLVELRALGKIQHIMLSTWYGEIDKYYELRNQLAELKIYLIEVHPLSEDMEKTPSGSVNYWRQARSLLFALDRIPKHDFVLRVRTDRSLNYINQMDKLGVFENFIHPVKELGKFPKLFEYQILVFRPRTIRLFQMTDFVLMGQNRDIYKLINFNVNDLQFQKRIVANAQWFSQPFLLEFPILRDYMRFTLYHHAALVLKRYSDKFESESYFPKVYSKVYAIYFLILHTHFNILEYEKFNPEKRDDIEFHNFFNGSKNGSLRYQSLGTIIVDKHVIENAILGKMKNTDSYSLFLSYVNKLICYGSNYHEFDLSVEEYSEIRKLVQTNFYEASDQEKWYRNLAFAPLNYKSLPTYLESNNSDKLNCLKVDSHDWVELSHTMVVEKQLYKLWVENEDLDKNVVETILLPIARTGNQYSIFILLDLFNRDNVKDLNKEEIIRISFFYLDIKQRQKIPSLILCLVVIVLLKISDKSELVVEDKFIKFALEAILSSEHIMKLEANNFNNVLNEVVGYLDCSGENFINHLFIKSVILEQSIPDNVSNYFNDKNMSNEFMISKFKWRNFSELDV